MLSGGHVLWTWTSHRGQNLFVSRKATMQVLQTVDRKGHILIRSVRKYWLNICICYILLPCIDSQKHYQYLKVYGQSYEACSFYAGCRRSYNKEMSLTGRENRSNICNLAADRSLCFWPRAELKETQYWVVVVFYILKSQRILPWLWMAQDLFLALFIIT